MIAVSLYVITIILYLFLAILVLRVIERSKAHTRFFLFLVMTLFWIVLVFLEQFNFSDLTIGWLNRADYAIAPVVAVFFLLFCLHFPKENKALSIGKEITLFIPGLIFTFFALFTNSLIKVIGGNNIEYNKLIFTFYFLTLVLYFLIFGAGILVKKYIKSTGLIRLQLKYLIIGFLISGVLVLTMSAYQAYLGRTYGLTLSVLINSVIIFAIFATYAMIRHRLMGIRLVIRRGAIYTISAILVFLIYTGLVFLAKGLFENYAAENRFALNSIAIVLIALGFEPLRRGVRGVIDAWFFPEGKKIEKSLQKMKQELPKSVDFNKFAEALSKEISQIISAKETGFFLLNKKEGIYHQIFPESEKDRIRLRLDDILVKYILSRKEIVVREELEIFSENKSQVEKEEMEKIGQEMGKYGWAACLPIGFEQVNGLLCLSQKTNNDAYTSEDIKFLDNLKNQASSALDNAILYKEAVERIKVS